MANKMDRFFEEDFLRLSRRLVREFGLQTAVMLSELYSEYNYWKQEGGLTSNGYFYSTVSNIYNNTGLSKHQQQQACNELESNNLITVRYHDMPRKRYFKLNVPRLNNLYNELKSESPQEVPGPAKQTKGKTLNNTQSSDTGCPGTRGSSTSKPAAVKFAGFSF